MIHEVRLSHAAETDIDHMIDYLVPRAGEAVTRAYLRRLYDFFKGFESYPMRGTVRGDIRDGLRVIGFERRLTIAFVVEAETVTILRILTRGRELQLFDDET